MNDADLPTFAEISAWVNRRIVAIKALHPVAQRQALIDETFAQAQRARDELGRQLRARRQSRSKR